jgi:hypothetical protein
MVEHRTLNPLVEGSSPSALTTKRFVAIAVLVIAACKGSSTSSSSTSGSAASGSAPVAIAIDAAIDAAPVAIDASTCKPKCLYAAEASLADAIAKHAAECKAEWYAADDCDGLLYARNCIYAAYGNVFKTAAWKDRFTKEPWYKPNAKFVEKDIPAFAMANIKALKKQYEACAAPVPRVTAEDVKLVTDAYNAWVLNEDNNNLRIDDKTTFEYDAAPKDGRRTITVRGLYLAVGGGEFKPDETASFTFDGDKLVEE